MIRDYHPADTAALVTLFRSAVLQTAASHYSPEQVVVWSSLVENLAQFQYRLSLGVTRVAVVQQQLAAFGQLYPNDHIEFLYTDSRFARQGYATLIYQQLEAEAIAQGASKLRTEASHIAQHFFLKMGFELLELEIVERAGLSFERFKMQKRLT
ncbi:MAG: GNAT family N-acetyltransferase [Pegethrix bostrychoides GSE-TBD4-15B]|jgi:putative acetyltransferase|uniref:GNAT family N-acetyltransferase n=1 Tax=Pegethrix bostrychoides GSE-TBD4-15B TaxID=2839662 RepID=A0A951PAS0_9CYAN|nr:GNAT family N-acetyltransferase [Pegethrix bostrychoides GSE-TBD4-15B]